MKCLLFILPPGGIIRGVGMSSKLFKVLANHVVCDRTKDAEGLNRDEINWIDLSFHSRIGDTDGICEAHNIARRGDIMVNAIKINIAPVGNVKQFLRQANK